MSVSGRKISGHSPTSVLSELDIFDVEPTQTQIEDAVWDYVEATDFSERSSQLKFIIPADQRHFLDISQSTLEIDVKIQLSDGSVLPDDKNDVKVFAGENFAHSLFSKASLSVNGLKVDYQDKYAEKAYFENLLNISKQVKKSHLSLEGWSEDYSLGLDGDQMPASALEKRKTRTVESRKQTFSIRPHLALFQQDKMIPPDTQIVFTLEKGSSKFALMAESSAPTGGGRVVITAARLRMRKCKLVAGAHAAIIKAWSGYITPGVSSVGTKWGAPANYNHKNAIVHRHTIPAGIRNKPITISNQRRPTRVFCCLTDDASAAGGDFKLNPFRFHHMNTNKIVLMLDGAPVDIMQEPDFGESGNASKLYHSLVSACGRQHHGSTNGITEKQFMNGTTIFAWDCSRSLSNKLEKVYDVQLKLEFGFSAPLPKTVSLLTYLEFDEHIQLTRGQPAVVT